MIQTRQIVAFGRTWSLSEYARHAGVSPATMHERLTKTDDAEKALRPLGRAPVVRASLVGQRFGRLTATELVTSEPATYRCVCDCGGEKDALEKYLRKGITRSCGCLQKDAAAAHRRSLTDDLEGQRFHDLVVLRRIPGEDGKHDRWRCRCDCGREHEALSAHQLRSGAVRRCAVCSKAAGAARIAAAGKAQAVTVVVFGETVALPDLSKLVDRPACTLLRRMRVLGMTAEEAAFGKMLRNRKKETAPRRRVQHRCRKCGAPGHNARGCST